MGELLGQQVSLDDLLDEGDKKKKVKKELTKSLKGVHSLPAPLTTPQQERAERSALYERVKEEVRSWDPVVHARRSAQQVTYPLQKADMKLVTAKQSSAAFKVSRTASPYQLIILVL